MDAGRTFFEMTTRKRLAEVPGIVQGDLPRPPTSKL